MSEHCGTSKVTRKKKQKNTTFIFSEVSPLLGNFFLFLVSLMNRAYLCTMAVSNVLVYIFLTVKVVMAVVDVVVDDDDNYGVDDDDDAVVVAVVVVVKVFWTYCIMQYFIHNKKYKKKICRWLPDQPSPILLTASKRNNNSIRNIVMKYISLYCMLRKGISFHKSDNTPKVLSDSLQL